MQIDFIGPLEAALRRTRDRLFRPFDLKTWFIVGFAAWLARLGSCGGPGGSANFGDLSPPADGGDLSDFGEWLSAHWPIVLAVGSLVLLVLAVAIVIGLVLLWIRAHGRFVFLDCVVRERAEIAAPWRRSHRLANSLFLWQLVFGLLVLLAMVLAMLPLVTALLAGGAGPADWLAVVMTALLFLLVGIACSVIMYFLHAFVVPIMYREGVTAVPAWGRFVTHFRAHPWAFLVFAVFVLVLVMTVGMAVLLFGLFTCCIGCLPLLIPYIGTVVLLPVPYFFRVYSLEFLAQFDPRLDLFAWAAEGGAGPGEAVP